MSEHEPAAERDDYSTARAQQVLHHLTGSLDSLVQTYLERQPDADARARWLRSVASAEVAGLVLAERARQDARWGQQNHPDVDPLAVSSWSVADHYDLRGATAARAVVQREAVVIEHGPSWLAILLEEVSEVAEAAENGDEVALEQELVQVAAVAVAQVEHLRRRRAARMSELAHTLARQGAADVDADQLRRDLGLPPRA